MTYPCPHCGKELSEDRYLAGICPSCHKMFEAKNEIKIIPMDNPEKTSALTPGEKQRIYEEEKTRLEAQEQIKIEQTKKGTKKGCLGCLGLIIVIILFLIPSMVRDKKSAPQRGKEAQVETQKEVDFSNHVKAAIIMWLKMTDNIDTDKIDISVTTMRNIGVMVELKATAPDTSPEMFAAATIFARKLVEGSQAVLNSIKIGNYSIKAEVYSASNVLLVRSEYNPGFVPGEGTIKTKTFY